MAQENYAMPGEELAYKKDRDVHWKFEKNC